MRTITITALALALLAGPAVTAAQDEPDRRREQTRERLEQEIRQRFLDHVARRLELTDDQRDEVRETLREGAEARRELAVRSRELRRDLMAAVRDDDTPLATFEALLQRLDQVRVAERTIAEREEARLADALDARQQAVFLFLRMRFNDRVRGMRGRPGGRGRPGPGGGPGGPFDIP